MTIRNPRSRLARMSQGAGALGIATFLAVASPVAAQRDVPDEPQEREDRQERQRQGREEGATGGGTEQRGMAPAEAVEVLTAINTGEIELARFGRERASSPRVRELAEELIRDHTQAQARLDEFARTESITPSQSEASQQVRSDARETRDRLESHTGAAFDREYVDAQIAMHREAIDMIDERVLPGAEEDFREVARSLRSTIQQHLTRAMELRGEVAATSQQPAQQGQHEEHEEHER